MKFLLPGGSGHIGQSLTAHWRSQGNEVVVLSRLSPGDWDGKTLGDWVAHLDGCDVVVNLVGRSVNCRYTEENLKQMMDSRVNSTRVLGQAISQSPRPPKLWLNSSTATIYAHRFDASNDEASGIIGGSEPDVPRYWDRSIAIARAWEEAFFSPGLPRTRRVALRSSMVMSPVPGGVFSVLLRLAKSGLLGTHGSGRQYVSWIHDRDFSRALDFLIAREDLSGAINVCSPNPLPNREFNRTLRSAAHAPIGLPAAAWMLKFGAAIMSTDTELLLKSRRVVPGVLLEHGFEFEFSEWESAAADLVAQMERGAQNPL